MRVIECLQGSEEWERWRNRPTASEFDQFCTPARGDYSKQATAYACKIVAKRLGVYTEPPPSFWMQWGTDNEPNARYTYQEHVGVEVKEVGFCLPDDTDAYGGSPDGLVGADGILETKCLAPENVIAMHAAGKIPNQYTPQIQGLLMITDRAWCDFCVYHPQLTCFVKRVFPDEAYQTKIAENLLRLLDEIERIESRVERVDHHLVSPTNERVRI